jgi:hypothetical protein
MALPEAIICLARSLNNLHDNIVCPSYFNALGQLTGVSDYVLTNCFIYESDFRYQ